MERTPSDKVADAGIAPREPLREQLAADEHDRWARWMRHLFSKCEWSRAALLIPAHWEQRWRRQVDTSYADLTEDEKDRDRAEADRILALVEGEAEHEIRTLRRHIEAERNVAAGYREEIRTLRTQLEQSVPLAELNRLREELKVERDKVGKVWCDLHTTRKVGGLGIDVWLCARCEQERAEAAEAETARLRTQLAQRETDNKRLYDIHVEQRAELATLRSTLIALRDQWRAAGGEEEAFWCGRCADELTQAAGLDSKT